MEELGKEDSPKLTSNGKKDNEYSITRQARRFVVKTKSSLLLSLFLQTKQPVALTVKEIKDRRNTYRPEYTHTHTC